MYLRRVLPFALLYATVVFPQTTDSPNGIFFVSSRDLGCPVEIRATLEGHAKLVPVAADKESADAQRLHLFLNNPSPNKIEAAVVSVHGYPKGARVAPAVLRNPDPDEIKRSFPLAATIAPGENISYELSLKELGALSYIDVDSLTYADGSMWRPAKSHPCRAFGNTPIRAAASTDSR